MYIEKNYNLDELRDYIGRYKIYCFGTGIQGKRWAYYLADWGLSDSCIGYIDNNTSLSGQIVYSPKRQYRIFSLYEVLNKEKDIIRIFITSLSYVDIVEQLKGVSDRRDIYCIVADRAADEQLNISDYDKIYVENDKPIIPRIIHYAWFGSEMPEKIKRNIDGWHRMCPEYEIKKWDDNNYNIRINNYMREAYDKKQWGFVPDYLRLDIIYKYGGFYLDTDIELIKNIDELRYQRCFGCCDASFTMNLGSGFGGVSGCEIIRELRDYYDDIHFVDETGRIDKTSCNTHSYYVLRKYGYQINDKLQKVKEMNIYPMIFQGACSYTCRKRITDKTFWVHYGNMSWM